MKLRCHIWVSCDNLDLCVYDGKHAESVCNIGMNPNGMKGCTLMRAHSARRSSIGTNTGGKARSCVAKGPSRINEGGEEVPRKRVFSIHSFFSSFPAGKYTKCSSVSLNTSANKHD